MRIKVHPEKKHNGMSLENLMIDIFSEKFCEFVKSLEDTQLVRKMSKQYIYYELEISDKFSHLIKQNYPEYLI